MFILSREFINNKNTNKWHTLVIKISFSEILLLTTNFCHFWLEYANQKTAMNCSILQSHLSSPQHPQVEKYQSICNYWGTHWSGSEYKLAIGWGPGIKMVKENLERLWKAFNSNVQKLGKEKKTKSGKINYNKWWSGLPTKRTRFRIVFQQRISQLHLLLHV